MPFTGLEREFLVVHGLCVKLRQRVRGGSKGGVDSPIYLIEARLCSFSLLTHPPKDSFVIGCERMVALLSAILMNYIYKKKKRIGPKRGTCLALYETARTKKVLLFFRFGHSTL